MTDKSKFEQMLEKLVADDKTAAEEIFHNIVVEKSRSKNINQSDPEAVLELKGIDYLKNNDVYEINLFFSNNAHIALTAETIEAILEDQSEIN